MASVQYVHTQRFQAEVVAFIQHFTQLQDVLGRQRAAMAGQAVSTVCWVSLYHCNHISEMLFSDLFIWIPFSHCQGSRYSFWFVV